MHLGADVIEIFLKVDRGWVAVLDRVRIVLLSSKVGRDASQKG